MGEAKRRLSRLKAAPCRCTSGQPAGQCCLVGNYWHKRPAVLQLKIPASGHRHPNCYLESLGTCSEKISGEHLVSKAVLKILRKSGLVVSGLPWAEGEIKIGLETLTANCLCTKHNSDLSGLDSEAARFFEAIRACDLNTGPALNYIFSGHDIERWLLKTIVAMAVSKNLVRNKNLLSGSFYANLDVSKMLLEPLEWPADTGLYCMLKQGDRIARADHFQLQPLTTEQEGEIAGVFASIQGISFALFMVPMKKESIAQYTYRPRQIQIKTDSGLNVIELSWENFKASNFVRMDRIGPAESKRLRANNSGFKVGLG